MTTETLSPFESTMATLVKGPVRTVPSEMPIVQAAQIMTEHQVGSLVVLEQGTPAGILTKTDLVRRVLSAQRAPSGPVGAIITRDVVTVDQQRPIFEGLLLMMQHNIGHLLVTDGGRLVGVVSDRDWLTFQEHHPAALSRELARADSVAELAALRRRIQRNIRRLFGEDGNAVALTAMVTEINDRVGKRLIELVLADLAGEFGAPPVPFAWIAMGSEGRGEQTLATDQDNGLVFQDVPPAEEEAVQGWFLRFAARVVEGLEICGFPLCKGNVMASNPDLCRPLSAWREKFTGYLQAADEEAMLRASIYFDFRCLYGEQALVDALWDHLTGRMEEQKGFLRHLAGSVMAGRPPVETLSWRLREALRLSHPPLDLKKQALAPLVAAARVLALAAGSRKTNTLERLEEASQSGQLPPTLEQSVRSAYDFLMLLRLRCHFEDVDQGRPISNLLPFKDLNPLERQFLIGSLGVVIELQDHVLQQFGGIQNL